MITPTLPRVCEEHTCNQGHHRMRRVDMITPTLPRVSARTWRNRHHRMRRVEMITPTTRGQLGRGGTHL